MVTALSHCLAGTGEYRKLQHYTGSWLWKMSMNGHGILLLFSKVGECGQLWHSPAHWLGLLSVSSRNIFSLKASACAQSTLLLPFWSQWECCVPYILQLPSYSQRVYKFHTGMPIYCLTLVGEGAGIPGLHGNVTTENLDLGCPPPLWHCMDSRLKYSSCEKDLIIAWNYSLLDRFQVSHTSTG